jgi:chemotaxis signal transduction protein
MSIMRSPATAASRALLDARAVFLARPPDETAAEYEKSASDALVILEIRLGDERVGIPLAQIVEIYRPAALSAVPGARAPVAGVAAWRGRVLTVLDLASARSGAVTLGEAARVVVIGTGRAMFGLFADEVEVVRSLDAGDLRPPENPSPARAGVVRGVTPDALVVLDAQALLQRHTTTNGQSETRII